MSKEKMLAEQAQCCTAERTPEVLRAITCLEDRVRFMEDRVSVLAERISPVLSHDEPATNGCDKVNPPSSTVPVAANIDQIAEKMARMTYVVVDLLERLEV